jgi:hypothetical protein
VDSRQVNPYIAGSPVTGTEMFFGREDVFSFVRRNLSGRHRDAAIVLYGHRRTGKTSVLYQMHRHLDPRYRCIFIDLHGLNLDGKANLLWGVANSIMRGLQRNHQLSVVLPDRAKFSANPEATFETIFLDAVWSVMEQDHLVLMIDEVIRLHEEVHAGRLEREVFDYLRHLMQHFERLSFVFSLDRGVEEMKLDYGFLFGAALYHRISFLEPAVACALITEPARGCYEVVRDAAEKILQVTSGHPYYTQLICHCLFDRWLRAPKPRMMSEDVDALLSEAIELGSANLTYVWEDSTPEEQVAMSAMAAAISSCGCPATVDQIRRVCRKAEVRLPVGEATNAIRSLAAREVVVASRGAYSFAVDLQRLWLDKHRRLDWVKEGLAGTTQKWDRPAKVQTTVNAKQSHRRRPRGFALVAILIAAGGISTLIAWLIIVSFTSSIVNMHSNLAGRPVRINNPAAVAGLMLTSPPDFAAYCRVLEHVTATTGLTAAIGCSPGGNGAPRSVNYYQYENAADMNAAFALRARDATGVGNCGGTAGNRDDYPIDNPDASSWACGKTGKQGEIIWTDKSLNILSVAVGGMSVRQLYDWFTSADSDTGPN